MNLRQLPSQSEGRGAASPHRAPRPLVFGKRECEEFGLSDMPTMGEYRAAIREAHQLDQPERAHLLTRLAIRLLERKQEEERTR